MYRSVFFSYVKKTVTIFKTLVTNFYGVILNATSQTCKNEPFSNKSDHGTCLNRNLFWNNYMKFYLMLNEKLRNNIESFLPEKKHQLEKTSKHLIMNREMQHRNNTGLGTFLKKLELPKPEVSLNLKAN